MPPETDGDPCEGVPGGCAIADLFQLLGRAHTLPVLHIFVFEDQGPHRFNEIEERLEISPNTLTNRLQELTEAGLLERRSYDEIPPRVEYEVTEKALDLEVVFDDLHDWAHHHSLEPEEGGSADAATA